MLKPKEKDKIRNVTWTGQTMNWQSRQRECQVFVQYFMSTKSWCQGDRNLHCLLRCGASRRAEYRTRSPHFQPGPKKPAWHSSQAKQGVAYSPSGTYYSLCAGAETEKLGSLDTGRAVEEDVFRPFIYHCWGGGGMSVKKKVLLWKCSQVNVGRDMQWNGLKVCIIVTQRKCFLCSTSRWLKQHKHNIKNVCKNYSYDSEERKTQKMLKPWNI